LNAAPASFSLGSRTVGSGYPCLIVAEVAQSHDGSLGFAHAFIDAIANAGADAVKFQTHIAAAESTPAEPWRVKFSPQDATRYDYWRRMEFAEEQWRGLKRHAEDRGLIFLSSPFSAEAVELLERIGMVAWKVASGEVSNAPLLERLLATGRPILLSSGMSPLAELDATVARAQAVPVPIAVLQCTTAYPCPPERIGLNLLPIFRDRYGCPVGLSDHSGTIFAGLAAATLGCDVLEVHVTLSREMFGPDVPASVTTTEAPSAGRRRALRRAPAREPGGQRRRRRRRRRDAPALHQERRRAGGSARGHRAGPGAPFDQEAGHGHSIRAHRERARPAAAARRRERPLLTWEDLDGRA